MHLQKEAIEARLGHYIHQDPEGYYLLSEDDVEKLALPSRDPTTLAVVYSAVAFAFLGVVLFISDKVFVH